jgi:biopolymer transport protein ExbD
MRRDLYSFQALDEINVTPLLDLAWTLLVVFIIAVTASVQGIKVDLPKASAAPTLQKPKTKAITIHRNGQIYLDTFPVSMGELETRLKQFKAVDPNFPVVLKGDSKIYYQKVIDVLDMLGRLEITQVGLVTQKLVK